MNAEFGRIFQKFGGTFDVAGNGITSAYEFDHGRGVAQVRFSLIAPDAYTGSQDHGFLTLFLDRKNVDDSFTALFAMRFPMAFNVASTARSQGEHVVMDWSNNPVRFMEPTQIMVAKNERRASKMRAWFVAGGFGTPNLLLVDSHVVTV